MHEPKLDGQANERLPPVLGTWQLWGLAVGLVISGEYFGWSYGWAQAGTLGFLVTTLVVAVMYTSFIFSFTELTTAIPDAGGPFAYARRAFGPLGGVVAGWATLVEFVFAPPAIALAIGAYVAVQFPALKPAWTAVAAYAVFMTLNIVGVTIAANFELIVTLLAVGELLVFMGVVAPHFSWANFTTGGWAGSDTFSAASLGGMLAATPFAIWFFLAIEGVAMAAEEARDPHRTIPRAYIGGMLTLVALALGVMLFAGGVGDWRELADINDPLPQAMKAVVGESSGWLLTAVENGGAGRSKMVALGGVAALAAKTRGLPQGRLIAPKQQAKIFRQGREGGPLDRSRAGAARDESPTMVNARAHLRRRRNQPGVVRTFFEDEHVHSASVARQRTSTIGYSPQSPGRPSPRQGLPRRGADLRAPHHRPSAAGSGRRRRRARQWPGVSAAVPDEPVSRLPGRRLVILQAARLDPAVEMDHTFLHNPPIP
ncbi:MAG: ethanolamine permease [Planctomycetota bacterium]